MRLRWGIWATVALAASGALLTAVPAAFKSAQIHLPLLPFLLAGAVLVAVATATKPVTDVFSKAWANRTQRRIDQQERVRQIERDAGGLLLAGHITDRALLGIHPSIPLPAGADLSLSPDLPLYIRRDIDEDLYAWIATHRQTGGFLLLVGPAAAGKTRCAYELIHETLANWPMLMPSTSAQLTEYVQANPSPARLIVWLNDTHKFLGPSGLAAATIHRLLSSPQPVIIVGTTWREHYDTLTALPATDSSPNTGTIISDPNTDAQEILTLLAHVKDLQPEFSHTEYDRARSLAVRDPRIAEALTHDDTVNISETLAATPDLIRRWVTGVSAIGASANGAAVLTAAVTARRCGYPEPLPSTILKPLAEYALTPAQRAWAKPNWFQDALEWARQPVRGKATPLIPQAAMPGHIDGDHVSDVLVQHASRNPDAPWHDIPEKVWLLLIDRATSQACLAIADAAYPRRFAHHAPITEQAIRKAAKADQPRAMVNLGILLSERGDTADAERWYSAAAKAGHPIAMFNLGILLKARGDTANAERWYSAAAKAGHPSAMVNLGILLSERGDTADAERWYSAAAKAGHPSAMFNLANLLKTRGNTAEAEHWYRAAGKAGHTGAMFNLGVLLSDRGETIEAEHWYSEAGKAGRQSTMVYLRAQPTKLYKAAETGQVLSAADETGRARAGFNLGILLPERDDIAEAEQWYRATDEA